MRLGRNEGGRDRGGPLWEPGVGCEQQRVGWDGSRGSDLGGVAVAWSANSRTRAGGAGRTQGCSRGGILCGRLTIAALASWMPLRRHTLW